ncbi:hypothetical protein BDW22DRAFT_65842 [Trametopsis cervina]|nr:hypothetical protein BDW22DRAFT_65842 [Trametopsis cervina]
MNPSPETPAAEEPQRNVNVISTFVRTVSIVLSSVGLTLSVLAHCIARLTRYLPAARTAPPRTLVRTTTLTIIAASVAENKTPARNVVSIQMDGDTVHFRSEAVTVLLNQSRRASMSAHAHAGLTTRTESNLGEDTMMSSPVDLTSVDEALRAQPQDAHVSSESQSSSAAAAEQSTTPPASAKPSLADRLPRVFRAKRKSVDSQANAVAGPSSKPHSRASSMVRSVSPRLRALSLRSEPEESATAHGRVPYVADPDDKQTFHTSFVNPLRPKRKSPSPSLHSTPLRKTFDLPESPLSPPPATKTMQRAPTTPTPPPHRRHRSLASYITAAIRPSSSRAQPSRSPSPSSRRSFSPYSSSSTTSSSSTSGTGSSSARSRSRRSFSFSSIGSSAEAADQQPVRRTQPYGPPYYAAMPVPRRSLSDRRGAVRVGPIREDEVEGGEQQPQGLGLEFGVLQRAR